jgi:TusA-related sulfurtransferase
MNSTIITLDVREDFRSSQHPCDKIQNALSAVGRNETLRLLVPFEPVPLFDVAAKKGLAHKAGQAPEGHWEVLFSHNPAAASGLDAQSSSQVVSCGCDVARSADVVDLDARGLEPPQPMVKILEALATLPEGAKLRAKTDRRPIHLYAFLKERGFCGESEEQSDGSFITHIRRS